VALTTHLASSAEVKKRVELYFYYPTGTSSHIIGWTFLFDSQFDLPVLICKVTFGDFIKGNIAYYEAGNKIQGATSRKVTGSIPDGVLGIFHLQSFQPHYGPEFDWASKLMSTRDLSWEGGGG
jgi:hypothetical protein